MCGIAGVVRCDGRAVDAAELQRFTDRLRHRGPDGAGYQILEPAGLGHRRLAIIDLEGGAQPLANEDETVWISYNGEIYNFQELRAQLERCGHRFRTHSDTEAIVHAYEEWGEDCVERLRGMFAFAIWDARRQRLFLARDRLGIKPLVYWHRGDCFYFASELQAFEALERPPTSVDLPALDAYLEHLYIPSPRTIYAGVCKLPAAHVLCVTRDGPSVPRRYWNLRFEPEESHSEDEWLDLLEQTLDESVRLHLIADVPVGAFLSSGSDSTLVVALMNRAARGRVGTYTIGFEDEEYNEADGAREVARLLGTDHHEEQLSLHLDELLPVLVRQHGEPFADCSAAPTYRVCALARRHVKAVLSGDGGDEAFAGYTWLYRLLQRFTFPQPSLRERWLLTVRNLLGDRGWFPERMGPLGALRRGRSCFSSALRRRLWRPELRQRIEPRPSLAQQTPELDGKDLCTQVQLLDYRWFLPDDVLTKVDIASMAHGLEVRVPLLDHRVVELAARMPVALKLRSLPDRRRGPFESKVALRRLLARYFPASVVHRPKRGFGLPLVRWQASLDWEKSRQFLRSPDARLAALFSPSSLRWLLGQRGRLAASQHWSFTVLAEWFRQHPSAVVDSDAVAMEMPSQAPEGLLPARCSG